MSRLPQSNNRSSHHQQQQQQEAQSLVAPPPDLFINHGPLGEGRFGSVFLVSHWENTEVKSALKIIHTPLQNLAPNLRHRVVVEMECWAAATGHAHIVALLGTGVGPDGRQWMDAEYVSGGTLTKCLSKHKRRAQQRVTQQQQQQQQQQPQQQQQQQQHAPLARPKRELFGFSEANARAIVHQLLLAVYHLHRRGFVHRDIKPDNILYDGKSFIKLTDFGLAKKVPVGVGHRIKEGMVGSPTWMAPEAFDGDHDGFAADVWSCGVVLFQCLTANFPFYRTDERQSLKRIILEWAPSVTIPLVEAGLSNECIDFVRGTLNPDPTQRLTVTRALNHPWFGETSSSHEQPTGTTPQATKRSDSSNAEAIHDGGIAQNAHSDSTNNSPPTVNAAAAQVTTSPLGGFATSTNPTTNAAPTANTTTVTSLPQQPNHRRQPDADSPQQHKSKERIALFQETKMLTEPPNKSQPRPLSTVATNTNDDDDDDDSGVKVTAEHERSGRLGAEGLAPFVSSANSSSAATFARNDRHNALCTLSHASQSAAAASRASGSAFNTSVTSMPNTNDASLLFLRRSSGTSSNNNDPQSYFLNRSISDYQQHQQPLLHMTPNSGSRSASHRGLSPIRAGAPLSPECQQQQPQQPPAPLSSSSSVRSLTPPLLGMMLPLPSSPPRRQDGGRGGPGQQRVVAAADVKLRRNQKNQQPSSASECHQPHQQLPRSGVLTPTSGGESGSGGDSPARLNRTGTLVPRVSRGDSTLSIASPHQRQSLATFPATATNDDDGDDASDEGEEMPKSFAVDATRSTVALSDGETLSSVFALLQHRPEGGLEVRFSPDRSSLVGRFAANSSSIASFVITVVPQGTTTPPSLEEESSGTQHALEIIKQRGSDTAFWKFCELFETDRKRN